MRNIPSWRTIAFCCLAAAAPALAQETAPSAAPTSQTPDARGYLPGGNLVPVPDPTALTTAAVDRAIANLKLELAAQFRAVERALQKADDDATRVPTPIDRAVAQIKDLVRSWIDTSDKVRDERFLRIDKQFEQDAKLREQLAIANSTAIAAALQAAEKAVAASNAERIAATAKSDAAFAEQLKTQQTIITTETKNLNDKLNDLKDRFSQREGSTVAAHDTRIDTRGDNSNLISLGALIIAALAVGLALLRSGIGSRHT